MTQFKSLLTTSFLGCLLFLAQCGANSSCSPEKTKEIVTTINQYLTEKLQLDTPLFSEDVLEVQSNGQIFIKKTTIDSEIARRFVTYRADMHENAKSKQKYLERWSNKDPSAASIFETSAKLAYKGKSKPCMFVTIVFESSLNRGQKVISLI